ncbi:hypothetical protein GYMLUDRAFT_242943 [Collybiopsis luxurians FD-317 M1]|uniref:Uncharacterized protein n=1 Tax=Collybiopsis luxurians FD-317 M1 TaxID=944289 RepID=A0A0D0CHX7_9AGAR|nr:hypothetical protein GYMLUDRAFT_242943 [Collybiopsis luxurians FD-317 M1]
MSRRRDSSSLVIDIFDDDKERWWNMPVVQGDELRGGLDEEDQKKYHYRPQSVDKSTSFSGTLSDERGADGERIQGGKGSGKAVF